MCPNRFNLTVDVAPNWKLAYISQSFFPNVAGSEIIDEAGLNGFAQNQPLARELTCSDLKCVTAAVRPS
jgi:hypothetical protein